MDKIEPKDAYPDIFTPAESQYLMALQSGSLTFGPRKPIVQAYRPTHQSLYLSEGFVARYRKDRFGRRQFLSQQIPGDMIDLPGYYLGRLDHDIESINSVTVLPTEHHKIADLRDSHPDLYDKLWRVAMMDAAIIRYGMFRLGRLMGRAKVANFLSEMMVRLFARGLCGPDGFDMPLSQVDLSEACGITSVHANRMLGELREENVCTWVSGRVHVPNFAALLKAGHFEWDYLYLPEDIDAALREMTGAAPPPGRNRRGCAAG
ncbi:Crp/Fnr family transcriptional regulator [Paracoccus sp. TK19116]|uniref:Crp/Fnr family transcriptional regulator n=1 Tax=Paracoccus albicereus TaxID=2922394 RepID=A0ABT1MSZ0_9RHOB|nr:Crp/Fnr family transcriptional regulator [Paracoccus albicereus]MCQ0970458.1 Crp/Fnr family transcriptional regulator [Paracoccus albicereus]